MQVRLLSATLLLLAVFGWSEWSPCQEDPWDEHLPTAINDRAGGVNLHYGSGLRRIVRIGGMTIALTPYWSGERTYRSGDA